MAVRLPRTDPETFETPPVRRRYEMSCSLICQREAPARTSNSTGNPNRRSWRSSWRSQLGASHPHRRDVVNGDAMLSSQSSRGESRAEASMPGPHSSIGEPGAASADREVSAGFDGRHELRQFRRIERTVAVDDGGQRCLHGRDPSQDSGTIARLRFPHDPRARPLGDERSRIRRSVVDDDHVVSVRDCGQNAGQRLLFIPARHHDCDYLTHSPTVSRDRRRSTLGKRDETMTSALARPLTCVNNQLGGYRQSHDGWFSPNRARRPRHARLSGRRRGRRACRGGCNRSRGRRRRLAGPHLCRRRADFR